MCKPNKKKNTYIHANDGGCTIIWCPELGVKHTRLVYVISELKIKLLCFFILSIIAWIFICMENTSIDCTKICNNSKRTEARINEVMQPTTSNNHIRNQMLLNHVLNQASFAKPVINGRDFIYLGISKMIFSLGNLERLIYDYTRIILGSWRSDD